MEHAYYVHWNPKQHRPKVVRSKLEESKRRHAQNMIAGHSDLPLRKGKR